MTETEIVTLTDQTSEIMSLEEAGKQFENFKKFVQSQMISGVDYGTIPGTQKPSLWKPGAEKLRMYHGLGVRMEPTINTQLDWPGDFFNYEYKAIAYSLRTQQPIAEAFGSANTLEDKFSKTVQRRGVRAADLTNSISKIAQKRAFVAVMLIATRASFCFTQDMAHEEEDGLMTAPATTPATTSADVISEKQRNYFWYESKNANPVRLQVWLAKNLPYTHDGDGTFHASLIKRADFEKVLTYLKSSEAKNA